MSDSLNSRISEWLPKPKRLFARSEEGKPKSKLLLILLIVAAVVVPILLQGFQDYQSLVRVLTVILIYGIMALGLNIVVGYAGMLDFGRIAFFAVGAYTAMLVGIPVAQFLGEALGGASYLVALPVSGVVAAGVALIIGLPMLRLRGDYLTIVTLGFAEIVRISITNNIGGLTNGSNGLPGSGQTLPKPFGLEWLSSGMEWLAGLTYRKLGDFIFSFDSNLYWYFVSLIIMLAAIVVIRRQDASRLGRSWAAMREDDIAAEAMGISVNKAKQYAFALGGFWGGVAGCLFAYYQSFISPESFNFMESIFVLSIVVIGGMGSIKGVVIGAIIIQGLPEFVRWLISSPLMTNIGIHFSSDAVSAVQKYRNIVLAIVMVAMMASRPQGILPPKALFRKLRGKTDDETPLAETVSESETTDGVVAVEGVEGAEPGEELSPRAVETGAESNEGGVA